MKSLIIMFVLAQSADTGTTMRALQQGCGEFNPLFQPPYQSAKMIGIKGGATVGLSLLSWRIRKRHPRYARTIMIVGTVAGFSAAGWNAAQACR